MTLAVRAHPDACDVRSIAAACNARQAVKISVLQFAVWRISIFKYGRKFFLFCYFIRSHYVILSDSSLQSDTLNSTNEN